ncbi:uncharacterized protein LOC144151777 isoform X2 [Haemaphysalis longicornis]
MAGPQRGPPGGLGAGRACCLLRAKVLRLGSPVCGPVGSARPRRLSIVGLETPSSDLDCNMRRPCTRGWSPHQQPPGMLQRRLPAGPLSAFSTLSRRRIDVAFT